MFEAPGAGGGSDFLLKIPGGGGVSLAGGGGEAMVPGGCLRGIGGGGGLNIFFRGRNSHRASSCMACFL